MEINCINDYEAFIERLRNVILDNIVGNYPDKTQDIDVTLEQREPFQLTLTIKTVSEELETTFDCIDFINPFEDLIEWLEELLKNQECKPLLLGYGSWPPIVFFEPLLNENKSGSLGYFSVYLVEDSKFVLGSRCNKSQLIESFYNAIVNCALESATNHDFIEMWIEDAYYNNKLEDKPLKEWARLFIEQTRSPLIEEAIGKHDEFEARCNDCLANIKEPKTKEIASANIKVGGKSILDANITVKKSK
jgi:hypothetical protein